MNRESKNKILKKERISNKSLWFVNIGGYEPSSMQEKHEFGLVVAFSSSEAKNKAKLKCLIDCKKNIMMIFLLLEVLLILTIVWL